MKTQIYKSIVKIINSTTLLFLLSCSILPKDSVSLLLNQVVAITFFYSGVGLYLLNKNNKYTLLIEQIEYYVPIYLICSIFSLVFNYSLSLPNIYTVITAVMLSAFLGKFLIILERASKDFGTYVYIVSPLGVVPYLILFHVIKLGVTLSAIISITIVIIMLSCVYINQITKRRYKYGK